MSRFTDEYDGEVIPAGLWDRALSVALGSGRGQEALARMERALLELPEPPRLVAGHLAIETMSARVQCGCGHSRDQHHDGEGCSGKWWQDRPCSCTGFDAEETEDVWETVAAGERIGLRRTIAWHLANLNDETFGGATPEERYRLILAWVGRAQGKPEGARDAA